MNYSADTWFFLELSKKNAKAQRIWKEVTEGKGRLVVSTIVVAETIKKFLKRNVKKPLFDFMLGLRTTEKIHVVNVSSTIAQEAGKLGYTFNIPIVDAIILSTAILTGHDKILTKDMHFRSAEKQKKIKIINW